MSQSAYRVRRATVDDLQSLLTLWTSMHIPTSGLEKRLTEFQVVESEDGSLLGAIGLEVAGRHGKLHSECFSDFALADALRQQLWERMQSLATNLGLARLWTQETAPFWNRGGFHAANEESLKKLPDQWATGQARWLTLRLRDEEAIEKSLDKEFARFKEAEKQRTQTALQRARALKFVATLMAVVLAIFVIVVSLYLYLHRNIIRAPGH
jgi:N-acetylglutamate synthase-like GNAT family acetyltransferase